MRMPPVVVDGEWDSDELRETGDVEVFEEVSEVLRLWDEKRPPWDFCESVDTRPPAAVGGLGWAATGFVFSCLEPKRGMVAGVEVEVEVSFLN